jgi:hypothetical protein
MLKRVVGVAAAVLFAGCGIDSSSQNGPNQPAGPSSTPLGTVQLPATITGPSVKVVLNQRTTSTVWVDVGVYNGVTDSNDPVPCSATDITACTAEANNQGVTDPAKIRCDTTRTIPGVTTAPNNYCQVQKDNGAPSQFYAKNFTSAASAQIRVPCTADPNQFFSIEIYDADVNSVIKSAQYSDEFQMSATCTANPTYHDYAKPAPVIPSPLYAALPFAPYDAFDVTLTNMNYPWSQFGWTMSISGNAQKAGYPKVFPAKETFSAPDTTAAFSVTGSVKLASSLMVGSQDPWAGYHFDATASSGTIIATGGVPPPPRFGLDFNPATVVGGTSSTGTITITPAPTGATQVTLTSGETHVVVPATATVTANQTSVTFSATTSLGLTGPVTVTATASGFPAATATLTLQPRISTITFAPGTVTHGSTTAGSTTGTITLSSVAPTGGAVVTLSSADSQVAVPSTITVAAGQTTATFTATALATATVGTDAITATYTNTATGSLTVN